MSRKGEISDSENFIVTIYPKNFPSDVEALISQMGWNKIADQEIVFQATDPTAEDLIPLVPNIFRFESRTKRLTLRTLLTYNLDIMAIPKRRFFLEISFYSDNEMHRERLLELSSPTFSDEYYDYATRPRRSILETLQEFSSVKIPWQDAAALFPKIRGRQFSIASGGVLKQHRDDGYIRLELLIAIVKYKTVLKKVRQGLCSRYIASLQPGTTINITFDSNQKFDGLTRKHPELVCDFAQSPIFKCITDNNAGTFIKSSKF
jgi:sulfite reductase alpha subunit-like flavoprotein